MMRRIAITGIVATLLAVFLAAPVQAQPTHDEVAAAIENGVAWLAAQQEADGRWGDWETCAVTGLAVKKLMHHAVDDKWGLGLPSPFDAANPYKENVEKGLEWLFMNCPSIVDIQDQPAGDPDTDGDGKGVWFGASAHHSSYTTGIMLMTLCETVELDRMVAGGVLDGWTYEEVARDAMDWLAFGQNDAGPQRGGWGYHANDADWSDNSNAGYVTLGLGFAEAAPPEGCGFTLPQFVKDELNIWIDYIQNDVDADANDGGSGYTDPNSWVNALKTGNLLQQMALVGDQLGDDQRVQDALDYLARHWADANQDPGWSGGGGTASYQATFTIMKGLTSFGLFAEFTSEGTPIPWQADFEAELVAEQNADGSWPTSIWDRGGNRVLSTTWALLTLQKIAPPPPVKPVPLDVKPTSCPNPLNLKGKGVLPVAIMGTEDLDVTTIDPATVRLLDPDETTEVAPLRWAMEDVGTPYWHPEGEPWTRMSCTEEGPDGYTDLTFKFKTQEVVAALGDVADGDVLFLRLSGNLKEEFGGTAIVGKDVVWILKKGRP